jgi:two-component system, cell cycle sensor histidine kinase and response regulator CckA
MTGETNEVDVREEGRSPADNADTILIAADTILIAEDDEGLRSVLADVLRGLGYRVLEARDGEHAVEIAKTHRGDLDLLIADLVTPRLSGYEAAEGVRQLHPHVAVLFISGYVDEQSLAWKEPSPSMLFLPKPFTIGELEEAVVSLINRA